MRDLIDDFLDTALFGRPSTIAYNTAGTKDMKPISWIKTETGYKGICRTVGINGEDLKVDLTKHTIRISGKTKYDGEEYSVNYESPIAEEIINNIEKVEYKTLNGLTYVYITLKKSATETIKAVRIK